MPPLTDDDKFLPKHEWTGMANVVKCSGAKEREKKAVCIHLHFNSIDNVGPNLSPATTSPFQRPNQQISFGNYEFFSQLVQHLAGKFQRAERSRPEYGVKTSTARPPSRSTNAAFKNKAIRFVCSSEQLTHVEACFLEIRFQSDTLSERV